MVKNHRTVASDSADRIFQERRRFVRADSNSPSLVFQLEFSSPVRHMQGTQAFTVSDVQLAEPDARLSVLPTCYTVLDQRDATASSRQVTARSSTCVDPHRGAR